MSCSSSVCSALWAALTVALAGCDRLSAEAAAPSGTATSFNYIGPVPGPGSAAPEPDNPYRGDVFAVAQGRTLWNRYNCSGCHGDHAGGGMGPSLRDGRWRYGGSDYAVFGSIAQGRGEGMPAWGAKVPEKQIWQIVAYIQTLRTDQEPSAPDQHIPPPVFP